MSDFLNRDQQAVSDAIENKTIFHSVVTKLGMDDEIAFMNVQLSGEHNLLGSYVGRIYIDESDSEMTRRSLLPLLGQKIPFVIIGIDEEHQVLICSRKQAQEKIKESMSADFAAGKVLRAKVVKLMPFGAFVEIDGISGLLRTIDFSSDHSEVSEYYNVGDYVDVVCKEISDKGRVFFKAATIHARKEPIKYDLNEGEIVMGKVRNLRNFNRGPVAFVHIATGLDCLCAMPDEMEIEKEVDVAVRILDIHPSEDPMVAPRVRGKIVRVY